jgi:hypothetical protein
MAGSSFENMPRWFYVILWFFLLWKQLPVLVRREEYERLKDLDYLVEDAHRALKENYDLRKELRVARGLPEFDFEPLSDGERP